MRFMLDTSVLIEIEHENPFILERLYRFSPRDVAFSADVEVAGVGRSAGAAESVDARAGPASIAGIGRCLLPAVATPGASGASGRYVRQW